MMYGAMHSDEQMIGTCDSLSASSRTALNPRYCRSVFRKMSRIVFVGDFNLPNELYERSAKTTALDLRFVGQDDGRRHSPRGADAG
jgi:hypothetical protein